jgi:hypothetical protein
MIKKSKLSRLLTLTLMASCLSLQSCTLWTICSVITYPVFFLLTTTEDQFDTDTELLLCKEDKQLEMPDDNEFTQNALAKRYLKLICR